MGDFKKRELKKTKRVCFRLKEAREAAGIGLNQLSRITKISKKHLEALEECRFEDIPYALVYQKNFVREYAAAVGISPEPILKQFVIEETTNKKSHVERKVRRVKKYSLQNLPAVFRGLGLAIVVLGVVGYLGFQVREIVKPPKLLVHGPRNGYITENPVVMVYGEAAEEARVYINGQEVFTNGSGKFEEVLDLSPGINTLVISAKKRHGKVSDDTRHVIVKEDVKFTLN